MSAGSSSDHCSSYRTTSDWSLASESRRAQRIPWRELDSARGGVFSVLQYLFPEGGYKVQMVQGEYEIKAPREIVKDDVRRFKRLVERSNGHKPSSSQRY
ncbi:hypothetical protein DL546_007425 [Coniochaeta pulveracea]|uniref:Uncharacterized protein n=1 Tax=Coniochaeta pulveracea TaxID=177199 RepID=A0A420YLW8_9PEZI|nr:hypothetical protein DL546_007425 [Coniochaeta pulveracea]